MATPTKQQKRAKRAASKAKQNRMVRSGQAVKPSAGDRAGTGQPRKWLGATPLQRWKAWRKLAVSLNPKVSAIR